MEEFHRLAGDDGGSDDGSAGSVRLRMVDSSSVHVHRHGAGARRDGGPPRIGSSRGGRTTKVHLGIDGKEMVKTVFLTPAQAAGCTQAEALLADLGKDETVIADKAYDTACDEVEAEERPDTGVLAGVDMNVRRVAVVDTTGGAEIIPAPDTGRLDAKIRRNQQRLARQRKGSRRRMRTRLRV